MVSRILHNLNWPVRTLRSILDELAQARARLQLLEQQLADSDARHADALADAKAAGFGAGQEDIMQNVSRLLGLPGGSSMPLVAAEVGRLQTAERDGQHVIALLRTEAGVSPSERANATQRERLGDDVRETAWAIQRSRAERDKLSRAIQSALAVQIGGAVDLPEAYRRRAVILREALGDAG